MDKHKYIEEKTINLPKGMDIRYGQEWLELVNDEEIIEVIDRAIDKCEDHKTGKLNKSIKIKITVGIV